MNISYQEGNPTSVEADALVVPVLAADGDPLLQGVGGFVDAALDGELARLAADARFTGKRGTTLTVPTLGRLPARRIVLAGLGPPEKLDADAVRRAWGAAGLASRDVGATSVVSSLPPTADQLPTAAALAAATEGLRLSLYRFDKYRGAGRAADPEPRPIEFFRFVDAAIDTAANATAIGRGEAVAAAVLLARDLVNEPANVLTPEAMAEHARGVAARHDLEIEVLGPVELETLGAGAILAVGRGSANAPRLIRLRYRPTGAPPIDDRVVGIVGKCITFDTGGYSIKPYDGMLEMKGDMAGGAAVLGAISALSALDCPYAVDATICAAENMISGQAFRPGDVLTALNGVTIEVLSTDAEGRLVLADGLVDAARRGATELIDLATLTGAAVVALGDGTTALFASDDTLAANLLAAASLSGERMWRMPLIEEFNQKIAGSVADIKNTGGRAGGAITAALFLERFREGRPWAHLDIAGSARLDKSGPLGPKGASGVGVRTLLEYLTT